MENHCHDCEKYHLCIVAKDAEQLAQHFRGLTTHNPGYSIYVQLTQMLAENCNHFEMVVDDDTDDTTVDTVDVDTDMVRFECQDCGAIEILPDGVKCIECEMCGSKDIAIIDLNDSDGCE